MKGTQIEVHPNSIIINGITSNYYEDRVVHFDEVKIEIISHLRYRHTGCILTFPSGFSIHIMSKESKESLKFEILSSHGLTPF